MSEEPTLKNMPKGHMERYHPHGIQEGDICKYLQGLGKSPKQQNSEIAKNRYANLAEGITADKAALWLRDNLSITCFHCKGEEDFKYLGIYDRFGKRNFLERGFPVSKEVFERDVKAFYAVCRDLTENYRNIELNIDWFIPWEFSRRAGGKSTLDFREGVSYVTIGDTESFPFQESRYAHNDERYIYDIIRHEIGHSLSTVINSSLADIVFQKSIKDAGEDGKRIILSIQDNVSEWASYPWVAVLNNIRMQYEGELTKFKEESYAELFSAYTDPDYDKVFPQSVISIPKIFCGEIIRGESRKDNIVMDGSGQEIADMADYYAPRPFWLTGLDAFYKPWEGQWVPIAELHYGKIAKSQGKDIIKPKGEPNNPYATWDYINGKWIEFKSREEKCRYLEKLYGRTDKEIEELINNRKLFDWYYPERKKGNEKK